ncbi:MAG: glycosyltransferase [Promethearchaeota archaeon]
MNKRENEILFSIIIPVLNEERIIKHAVDALLNQDIEVPYELVIIDNGSTDSTISILKSFKDKRIKVHGDNGLLGHVRNVGISLSKGKFIAFCDADQITSRNWLREFYRSLQTHDIVIGPILSIPHHGKEMSLFEKYFNLMSLNETQDRFQNGIHYKFNSGNVALKKEILEKNDVKFNDLLPISEDGDFSIRLLNKISDNAVTFNIRARAYTQFPKTIRQFYSYYKKLAIGNVYLMRLHSSFLISFVMALIYPITPRYWLHFKKKLFPSFLKYVSLGVFRFFISFFQYLNFKNYKSIFKNFFREK